MKTLLIMALLFLSACQTSMLNGSLAANTLSFNSPPKVQKEPEPVVYVSTRTFAEMEEHNANCKAKKIKPAACAEKFQEMLSARITLAYPEADYNKVALWCKAEPKICDPTTLTGANAIEDQIRQSESDVVEKRDSEKRQAAEEQDRVARKAALRAWGQSQLNKQASCTQTRIGNTVYTNCR